uniref:Uncharacterized protein n=1 Tax=Arundo donax TaxID=35708 RepID=A0A0A9D393_ARUDO
MAAASPHRTANNSGENTFRSLERGMVPDRIAPRTARSKPVSHPPEEATEAADSPAEFNSATSAPADTRAPRQSSFLWREQRMAAVSPASALAFTSQPLSTNICRISGWPRRAAMWTGLDLALRDVFTGASGSAPDASKVWTAPALPQRMAWWRRVRPRCVALDVYPLWRSMRRMEPVDSWYSTAHQTAS